METFEKTNVFNTAVEKLLVYRKLILVSGQGYGKTSLGKELLVYFSSENDMFHEKTPVIMRHALEWHDVVNPKEDVIVLLDDIFGKLSVDTTQFITWARIFSDISTCINDESTSVYVIITVRKNIFRNVTDKLKLHDLFRGLDNFVISLDENTLFSSACKRGILLRHFAHPQSNDRKFCINDPEDPTAQIQHPNSICINKSDVEAILSAPSFFAFPLCCREYVNNEKYFNQGPLFFTRPVDLLFPDIKCLCEEDKYAYFLLTLIFFSRSQKLDLGKIDNKNNRLLAKEIADFCYISKPFKKLPRILKSKICELTGIYVNDTNSVITFIAEVLSEVMLRIIGDTDMAFLIRTSELSILKLYTSMLLIDTPSKLYISPNHFKAWTERFLSELKIGNVEEVGSYEGMEHQPFVDEFINALHREDSYYLSIRQKDHKSNRTLFLSACASDPPRYPLIQALLDRPPMERRLLNIFKQQEISKRFTNQMCSVFESACSEGHIELSKLLVRYIPVTEISSNILFAAAKNGNEDVFTFVRTCKTWSSKILTKSERMYYRDHFQHWGNCTSDSMLY